MENDIYRKLKRPFPEKAISWRAGATNAKKNNQYWGNVNVGFIPGKNNENLNTDMNPVSIGINPLWTGGTGKGGGKVETIRVTLAMNKEDFEAVTTNWGGVKKTKDQGLIVVNNNSDLKKINNDPEAMDTYSTLLNQEKNIIKTIKNVKRPDGTTGDIITIEVDNQLNPNSSRLFENKTNSEYIRKMEYNNNLNQQKNESTIKTQQEKIADILTNIY